MGISSDADGVDDQQVCLSLIWEPKRPLSPRRPPPAAPQRSAGQSPSSPRIAANLLPSLSPRSSPMITGLRKGSSAQSHHHATVYELVIRVPGWDAAQTWLEALSNPRVSVQPLRGVSLREQRNLLMNSGAPRKPSRDSRLHAQQMNEPPTSSRGSSDLQMVTVTTFV